MESENATQLPSAPALAATQALTAFQRLDTKQRAFVKAYVSAPWSLPKACRSAGYQPISYRTLLQNPLVIEALKEEAQRLRANEIARNDVISAALGMWQDQAQPAMARVRAMELVADILGVRQSRVQDGASASASVIVSPSSASRFADPLAVGLAERGQAAFRELEQAKGKGGE